MNKIHDGNFEDRLYGTMELTELAAEIANTQPFQRLDNIRQSGTEMHRDPYTRFTHSMQVRHVFQKPCIQSGFTLDHPITITFADCVALTHDIGHGPFSHHFENAYTRHVRYENKDQVFFHDARGSNIIDAQEYHINGKTYTGIGSILQKHGIDPKKVIEIVLGHRKSPLKSQEQDAEFGADHLASALSDFFYNTSKENQEEILGGIQIREIIDSLRLALRPESSVPLEKAQPEDLIIATTSLDVARAVSNMSREHNKLIFSETGIANQFASYMLFKLMFEQGCLDFSAFESTEKEVIRIIQEAAEKNRKIQRLYELIFENKLVSEPGSFSVERVSYSTNTAPTESQVQVRRTYGFGLAYVPNGSDRAIYTHKDPGLFETAGRNLSKVIGATQRNLADVAQIRGTYAVKLARFNG